MRETIGVANHETSSTHAPKHQEVVDNCMNDSNSVPKPAVSRLTLKLKPGARKRPDEIKLTPISPSRNRSELKPGARWSDEYKQRMQEEMDVLVSR